MSTNVRDRKARRVKIKEAAFGVYDEATKRWNRTPVARCAARDKNGHRCNQKPHERGNHRAFGKEWK